MRSENSSILENKEMRNKRKEIKGMKERKTGGTNERK
jgi:hypothetical protein